MREIIIVAVVVLAAAAFFVVRDRHPGGDPGGRVYASLKEITFALPPGATAVRAGVSTEAKWRPACSNMPGTHAGWDKAEVSVWFTDTKAPESVGAAIGSVLVADHWEVVSRSAGSTEFEWKLPVKAGSYATAFAYPVPKGSTQWVITASWQPPGPVDQGCP
jgi:hypothetical protein